MKQKAQRVKRLLMSVDIYRILLESLRLHIHSDFNAFGHSATKTKNHRKNASISRKTQNRVEEEEKQLKLGRDAAAAEAAKARAEPHLGHKNSQYIFFNPTNNLFFNTVFFFLSLKSVFSTVRFFLCEISKGF